ncbi:MAG: NAD(P)-dependent oxidoreductase [Chlamydiota bacterium]
MKVFIAGATGAIGHPLVCELLDEGHEVFGMTRSEERAMQIAKLGATPVIADALNESSVLGAVKLVQPEVVIEMLTSLPKIYTPQAMREASALNDRLRTEGGAHLQKAAEAARCRRYMVQSTAFWYAPGPGLATEEDSFACDASAAIAAGSRKYADIEKRVLQSDHLEGVALRFGIFYGPGTWYAPDGNMADQVRHNSYPIVGGGQGVWNFVHVKDAAKGISLALHAKPGAYNLTGDDPIALSQWLPAYARWLGAPPPPLRTSEEELEINGADSVYYATQLRGASNAKAKRDLGFAPRTLEFL